MTARDVEILSDVGALHEAAAERFVRIVTSSIQHNGRCSVALAGGATPNGLYALLASKPFRSRVPWHAVHVFWGDERCVPPDDPRSNYRAAYELLLAHVPVLPANIHRIEGEREPSEAAARYETSLRAHFETPIGAPRFAPEARFDLVLLGLGTDGHTASLFPGGNALHERERWVTADYAPSQGAWRVTLTPPLLNAAARVQFMVAGSDKREILTEVLAHGHRANAKAASGDVGYPAQAIVPLEGELCWLVDAAAAGAAAADERPPDVRGVSAPG